MNEEKRNIWKLRNEIQMRYYKDRELLTKELDTKESEEMKQLQSDCEKIGHDFCLFQDSTPICNNCGVQDENV